MPNHQPQNWTSVLRRASALVLAWIVGCSSLLLTHSAKAQTPPNEIVELARALKNDPDLIYEYVYNNIRTLPMQGSMKGILGTMLDGEGTDIDQAELMVTLLRLAGYTANYALGSIHLSGNQLANWLGTDTTDSAIENLLFQGGFQNYGCAPTGGPTVTDCHFDWVWVQVTIGGTDYLFDPATKYFDPTGGAYNPALYGYNRVAGLGASALMSAMGYSRSTFIADAGAVTTTAPWSLASLNRTALRSDLASYATNLVQYLRANAPAAAPSDIIGGTSIIPLPLGTQQRILASSALAYQFNSVHTTSPTIPGGYRVLLTQQLGYMSGSSFVSLSPAITFNTADIYGHRATLSFSGAGVGSLLVDGVAQISASGPVPGGVHMVVQTTIDYNYGNTVPPNYFPGISNDTTTNVPSTPNGLFALFLSLGSTSRAMIENHRRQLAQNIALNLGNPAAEPVLGESLMIMAYTYTAQCAQFTSLAAQLGGAVLQNFNYYGTFGVATVGGVTAPQISIWAEAKDYTQSAGRPAGAYISQIESNVFVADGIAEGMAESATIQQSQPNNIGFSVPRALDIAVQQGINIYDINNATEAANNASYYTSTVRPLLAPSWTSADLGSVDTRVSQGERIIAPQSGSLTVQSYLGAGYTRVAQQFGFDSLGGSISGGLNGGSGSDFTPFSDVPDNAYFTITPDWTDPAYVVGVGNCPGDCSGQKTSEPINLVTGDYTLNAVDLSTGGKGMPYGLSFQRYYDSGARLQNGPVGLGWVHNFAITALSNSDPFEALAAISPINGAAAIAATLVALDVASIDGVVVGRSLDHIVIASLIYVWASDQMAMNIVAVTQPGAVEHFYKLSDGTYNPPPGSAAVLTFDGTKYKYVAKDQTVLQFDAAGNLITWVSSTGASMTLTYTGMPEVLSSVANNLGRSLTFAYISGLLTRVTDDSGRSVSYTYDSNSNLATFIDTLGQTTTYAYDQPGRMTQIVYPWAPGVPSVTNLYDSLNRVQTQTNVFGATWQYFLAGMRSEEVKPLGTSGVRHVIYVNSHGRTTTEIQDLGGPNQNVTTSAYDALDRLVSATAPEGNSVAYTYDLNSNVLTTTKTAKPGSPLAPLATTVTYDPVYNKPLTVTDPRGLVATMSYDPATGNLLSSVADSGSGHFNATTRYSYNSVGLPLLVTDPMGTVTQNTYDSVANLISTVRDYGTGHLNLRTSFTYTGPGDAAAVTDPRGNVTTSTYDAARRRLTTTSPPVAAAAFGIRTAYTYDPAGRVTQTQQTANNSILRTTSSAYTLSGKTATTTDANGNVARFAYDVLDRLTTATDAMNRVTQYAYDTLDRRISASNPAISATPLVQQGFTPNGQRASLTDANSNITGFAYDGFDRLGTTTYPDTSTETAVYDSASNVTSRGTRAGQSIAYAWDTLNRLSTKTPSAGATVSYGYDLAGRRTGVSDTSSAIASVAMPGSTTSYTTSYSYDALNRPMNVGWSPAPAAATASLGTPVTFTHTYNKVNQRTGQSVSDNSWIGYPSGMGTTAYTTNTLNQYTAVGATSPTYDGNANLTFDGTHTLGYDVQNRLTSATATGMTASYAFDGRGRRKLKTVNAATTVTITDASNRAVLEYDGTSGAVQRWFAYGLGSNDVLSQMNVAASTRATLIQDMLDSVVAAIDSGTGTVGPFAYKPYGSSALTPGTVGYTGQQIDTETGFYYYRARHYHPGWGRFAQTDPSGFTSGSHLYSYVSNDPLNSVDLNGLWQLTISGGYYVGGSFTVGYNSGQWNVGAWLGAADGISGRLNLFDSGPRTAGFDYSARGQVNWSLAAVGRGGFGMDNSFTTGNTTINGSWSLGSGMSVGGSFTDPTMARSVAPTIGGGASAFLGLGVTWTSESDSSSSSASALGFVGAGQYSTPPLYVTSGLDQASDSMPLSPSTGGALNLGLTLPISPANSGATETMHK